MSPEDVMDSLWLTDNEVSAFSVGIVMAIRHPEWAQAFLEGYRNDDPDWSFMNALLDDIVGHFPIEMEGSR